MSEHRKTVSIICSRCNGTGKYFYSGIGNRAFCPNCEGTGFITTYVTLSTGFPARHLA